MSPLRTKQSIISVDKGGIEYAVTLFLQLKYEIKSSLDLSYIDIILKLKFAQIKKYYIAYANIALKLFLIKT